jgi:hypothetical protein
MIRVRQLCGGGLYRDRPYWISTIWFGVKFETAWYWLKRLGWGGNRCGCGVVYCQHVPLRLRLKGRCWIEAVDAPAVFCADRPERARPDSEPFTGRLPRIPEPVYQPIPRRRKRKVA